MSGLADDEAFVSLPSGIDPSTGVPLGRVFGEMYQDNPRTRPGSG
jgi:hypothetical protein